MVHKISPIRIDDNGIATSNDKQKELGTSQGNIHSPYITQETNAMTSSSTNTGEYHNVGLSSLKSIDCIHLPPFSHIRFRVRLQNTFATDWLAVHTE